MSSDHFFLSMWLCVKKPTDPTVPVNQDKTPSLSHFKPVKKGINHPKRNSLRFWHIIEVL